MKIIAVLLFVSLLEVYSNDRYVIKRFGKDVFEIRDSKCSSITTRELCIQMDGEQRVIVDKNTKNKTALNCTCRCQKKGKNVFGYFNKTWKCGANEYVRNNAACYVKTFDNKKGRTRTLNSPLLLAVIGRKLASKSVAKINIGNITLENKNTCILENYFSYLNCTNTRTQMGQSSHVGFGIGCWASNNYTKLLIYYNNSETVFNAYSPKIDGHIIKLNINCTNIKNTSRFCVLLKVKGEMKCPIVNVTGLPTGPSAILPTASNPLTTLPTNSNPSTTQKNTESLNETEPPKDKSSATGNTGVIGGSVGGVAAVIAILAIIFITRKKRKRNLPNDSLTERAEIAGTECRDNGLQLAGLGDHDDEYSYAYCNTQQVVVRDANGRALKVAKDNILKMDTPSVSPPNAEAPIYNTPEEPDMSMNNADHDEPEYNVLQGPESEGEPQQGPSYEVLEDPNYNSAALYNILEGPDPDEPHVYGSLVGQDLHIYGPLFPPNKEQRSGCDIRPTDDVNEYQQLDVSGQRSPDDVYQPLRHSKLSDNPEDMSEDTQSHA